MLPLNGNKSREHHQNRKSLWCTVRLSSKVDDEMSAQRSVRPDRDRRAAGSRPTAISKLLKRAARAYPIANSDFQAAAPRSNPILLTSELCRRLGLTSRSKRIGPELELITVFLERPIFTAPPQCEMAVFQEPRLPSGYPDLVVAFWRRDIVLKWQPARQNLLTDDIRLVHHLFQIGPAHVADLQNCIGRKVSRSLERLRVAGMVKPKRDQWALRPLREIFAIKQLIAVEAKVSEWRGGLKQAWLNTWFASASYLLIPQLPRRSTVLDRAKEIGIGVCTLQERVIAPRCRPRLPASYASWLFNEWVGRIPALMQPHGKRA